MAVDDFYNEVCIAYIFRSVEVDYIALVVGVVDFLFHHAFADGGHLRTAFGVYDCCNDVAAECGTDLIEQVGVFLACFRILVVADLKRSAVGGESAVEAGRYARTEVASYTCCSHQADLGLDFLEKVDQYGCVGI